MFLILLVDRPFRVHAYRQTNQVTDRSFPMGQVGEEPGAILSLLRQLRVPPSAITEQAGQW